MSIRSSDLIVARDMQKSQFDAVFKYTVTLIQTYTDALQQQLFKGADKRNSTWHLIFHLEYYTD